jgi:hypothetical protein
MANINESIEKLTASLQELTAHTYSHADKGETVAGSVSVDDLQVSAEVESFVAATRAYTEKTRNVSVGTY